MAEPFDGAPELLHVDGELHVKGSLLEQKKHLFGEGIVSIIHSPGQ